MVRYYDRREQRRQVADATQVPTDPAALLRSLQSAMPADATSSGALPPVPGASPSSPAPAKKSSAFVFPKRHVAASDGQCALFTKDELTTVLGSTFTQATADATGCTYKGDHPREWVRTEAQWSDGAGAMKPLHDMYESLQKNMPKENIPQQPYAGVGDDAFVNLWNVVRARKADVSVAVDLRYYHDSDDLTRQIVNAALDRISPQ